MKIAISLVTLILLLAIVSAVLSVVSQPTFTFG